MSLPGTASAAILGSIVVPQPAIVVVNQESMAGHAALAQAIELALAHSTRLVVLTVIPRLLLHPLDCHMTAWASEIDQGMRAHHRATLRAIPAEIAVESTIAYGSPRRRIREVCKSSRADLLIIPKPYSGWALRRLTAPTVQRAGRTRGLGVLVVGAEAGCEQPCSAVEY
jgi:hypothetical protein